MQFDLTLISFAKESSAPNGAKSESIYCKQILFSTIDVQADGKGQRVNFAFSNRNAYLSALQKIKLSTKELPSVIIIDRDCRAHSAHE